MNSKHHLSKLGPTFSLLLRIEYHRFVRKLLHNDETGNCRVAKFSVTSILEGKLVSVRRELPEKFARLAAPVRSFAADSGIHFQGSHRRQVSSLVESSGALMESELPRD